MERLFKLAYFAGLVIEMLLRIPRERQRRQIQKTDQRVTTAERSLLGVLFAGMVFLPLIYSLTKWLDFANYRLSPPAKAHTGTLGTLLLSVALWLFWRSHRNLGTNWSPSLEIGAAHTLTTHGVYRAIRHPMYASQWLWGVSQALLLHNWIAGFASLVTFLPLYLVRVPREEQMMLDHFGDAYRDYAARTGRVIPRLLG